MNALTALFLWMLSHFAPAEVVCAQFDLPAESCDEQRAYADLQPGDAPEGDNSSQKGEQGTTPRVRTPLEMSRASRINNGF